MKFNIASLLPVAALLLPGLAFAQGAEEANLAVTASVAAGCTITTTTLAFGAYDTVSGAQVDAAGALHIACTSGTDETITLDQGLNDTTGSTDVPERNMNSGSDMLAYTLYSDPLRQNVWGDAASDGVLTPTAASSAVVDFPVYGSIAAGQDVPASTSYADSVLATVSF